MACPHWSRPVRPKPPAPPARETRQNVAPDAQARGVSFLFAADPSRGPELKVSKAKKNARLTSKTCRLRVSAPHTNGQQETQRRGRPAWHLPGTRCPAERPPRPLWLPAHWPRRVTRSSSTSATRTWKGLSFCLESCASHPRAAAGRPRPAWQ